MARIVPERRTGTAPAALHEEFAPRATLPCCERHKRLRNAVAVKLTQAQPNRLGTTFVRGVRRAIGAGVVAVATAALLVESWMPRLTGVGAQPPVLAAAQIGFGSHGTVPASDELSYVHEAVWRMPPGIAQPIDVALAPTGGLYVAEGRHNDIQVYDAFGRMVSRWDHPPVSPAPEFAFVPRTLAVDWVTGRVYIIWGRYSSSQPGGGLVQGSLFLDIREPDGTAQRPLRALPPEIADAVDVAIDAGSGDLYIYDGFHVHMLDMPAALVTDVFDAAVAPEGVGRIAVLSDGRVALVTGEPLVRVYSDGTSEATFGLPGAAVALAVAGQRVYVLLADEGEEPGSPVIVALDGAGRVVDTRDAGEMGLSGPPLSAWPWSLDTDGTRWAFSTGVSGFFEVRRVGPGDGTGTVDGGVLMPSFTAGDLSSDLLSAAELAVAPGPGGRAVVLDAYEGRLLSFDAEGRSERTGAAATNAVDVAVDEAGATYVTTASGSVSRLAPGQAIVPSYEVACDCDLGGRLTVSGGELFITRSRSRRIAALDAATGRTTREIWLSGAVGLWPADVAAASQRLYAADLVTTRIDSWGSDPDPLTGWQAGLLAGPRRLAVGAGPDGRRVIAAVMADGYVELHDPDDGNLLLRWRPQREDGSNFAIADIAFSTGGRLLLSDAPARVIRVFGPGIAGTATPPPEPRPTATPSDLSCHVAGSKVVSPVIVPLGGTARVTLTLAADCPARTRVVGADVVLAVDHSGSMTGANLAAARAAARSFVELLDVRYHRVALATFSGAAVVDVPLTDNVAAVIDGLYRLIPEGETNLIAAVEASDDHLQRFGRPDALPVIVLLTDGRHNVGGGDPRTSAQTARARGVQVYTIGLGNDADTAVLRAMAGHDDRYFSAPSPAELFPIYGEILRVVVASLAGNLVIDDQMAQGVALIPRSASPAALETRGRLRWGRSILPSTGITLTYDVMAQALGLNDVNSTAVAEYTDADGVRRTYTFPVPQIEVVPQPSTPTATIETWTIYLPGAFNRR